MGKDWEGNEMVGMMGGWMRSWGVGRRGERREIRAGSRFWRGRPICRFKWLLALWNMGSEEWCRVVIVDSYCLAVLDLEFDGT